MANISIDDRGTVRGGDRVEYRVYFAIVFPFTLVAALIRRITPGIRSVPSKSIFHEASEYANSVLPWIFSGR